MKAMICALALILVSATSAMARPDVNVDDNGVAIRGYDLVAYFIEGSPVEGSRSHEVVHDGVRYRFASAANAGAFKADPARYLPAYGGFCAYGVAMGKKFDTDPHVWKIVDDRLFFEHDPGTRVVWQRDIPRNVAIADRIWPEISQTPGTSPGK
ncbi:MAG: YHS domain-containing (seleno)protein [Sneathiellaceae bacterium]